MDRKIREFMNHLFDMVLLFIYTQGLINTSTVKDLIFIYNKQKLLNKNTFTEVYSNNTSFSSFNNKLSSRSENSDINSFFKDIMQSVLFEYLVKQDHLSLTNIANDIISKFMESDSITKVKYAKKNYVYYLKFFRIKMGYYFKKWKGNIHKRWIREKDKTNSETTEMKKHRDEMMSCTFKPRINRNNTFNRRINKSADTFQRLYSDHEIYLTKKAFLKAKNDDKENLLHSHTPNLTINNQYNLSSTNGFLKFHERQNEVKFTLIRTSF